MPADAKKLEQVRLLLESATREGAEPEQARADAFQAVCLMKKHNLVPARPQELLEQAQARSLGLDIPPWAR